MDRTLNRSLLEAKLAAKGLTQTSLADALGVTKAAVSKWLTGKSFPRAPELLKIGRLLGLAYADLVVAPTSSGEPLVAFRRRASTKTTDEHIGRAKEMGAMLAPLVKHLPFSEFMSPRRLKNPTLEYDYLQRLVGELRRDLKLSSAGPIEFTDLIGKFKDLQAVIIPVLWGSKQRHENALHIYLPDSKTTWIYLNLDSHRHDFKFWMAHELGHVLAVDLLTPETLDQAEDFSDAFAGALLFPEAAAAQAYTEYSRCTRESQRLDVLLQCARGHVISPNSVFLEIRHYAEAKRLPFVPVAERALFATITTFNKGYPSVSTSLFDGKVPSADHFMRICEERFKTPVFAALALYLKESSQGAGVISRMLDVPLADAKELHQALL